MLTRRRVVAGLGASGLAAWSLPRAAAAQDRDDGPVTFLFAADIHACRMETGLSPHCREEGKTDENLRAHVNGLNALAGTPWPTEVAGAPSGLSCAGQPIDVGRGLVIGGDMTNDGGGQTTPPSEGTQLFQFTQRYQQGVGEDRVHMPVYVGLGNHDLDQDGPARHEDWYRRELRDYVELNHRPSVIFHPLVPVENYDSESDCYSWNWGRLHLIQAHRFAGDRNKGASGHSLPWLARDLATFAADGRPVVLFQHYGWDPFSVERWNPARMTFDDEGTGPAHWWTEGGTRRAALGAGRLQRGRPVPRPRTRRADDLSARQHRSVQAEGRLQGRLRGGAHRGWRHGRCDRRDRPRRPDIHQHPVETDRMNHS